jgi:catechol 2,3-dioxygenase-like lactoylglutathione lyase family enzyme
MPQRLALTALLVAEYDPAILFFTRAMGWDLVEDVEQGGGKRWVVVAPAGGSGLLLARAVDEGQRAMIGKQGGGRVFLFLETDDFDRDHARMSAAGVRFLEAPRREVYGTVAVFEDISGNRWDLIERV